MTKKINLHGGSGRSRERNGWLSSQIELKVREDSAEGINQAEGELVMGSEKWKYIKQWRRGVWEVQAG